MVSSINMQTNIMSTANEPLTIEHIKQDHKEICRLCGKISQSYVSIFDENDLYVAEKISRCLPIIVLATDKLPPYICTNCLHHLNISYKLIITSLEVDTLLRKRLAQLDENACLEATHTNNPSESIHRSIPRGSRNVSLKELKRRAIAGPAECEICNIPFEDIDAFDNHMEIVHLLQWKCNLCDNSFQTSAELVSHKSLKHEGNILSCKTCNIIQDNESVLNPQEMLKLPETLIENIHETQFQIQIEEEDSEAEVSQSIEVSGIQQITNQDPFLTNTEEGSNSNNEKNISVLSCNICKISFGDEHHSNAHKKIHESKQMKCILCRIKCSSIYDLFLHKRIDHNMYKKVQLKYVCDKCGKFFTSSWQWEYHKVNNCPKKTAEKYCKYCNSVFSTNHKLMRHLRKHKSEMFNDPTVTVYKCTTCPKIFVDKELYEKHRNVHDPECWDKYKCNVCDRRFRDNVRLKEHKRFIHEGVKPHQCDVCGRSFHRSYNMKIHRITHYGHNCAYCGKNLTRLQDLVKHIKTDHGIEPDIKKLSIKPKYMSNTCVCRYCGRKLASYQSLINHEYIHTGEKPYSCKMCHKTFRSYVARWSHMQHHQVENVVCEICGKCFCSKQKLTVHIQTHLPLEDHQYKCTACGKKFVEKSHLNVHVRTHDGTRPFTCDICFLTFTKKNNMTSHRMRHSKGNMYAKKQKISSPSP